MDLYSPCAQSVGCGCYSLTMEHPIHLDGYIPEGSFVPPPGSITRIKGVMTSSATSTSVMLENVIENMKLGLPMFANQPEFNKVKGNRKRIALVGGGPSLKKPEILDELREFKTVISCGSVHDFLMDRGIIPTYAVNCDPSDVSANYYTKPDTETKYLMASNSHKNLLKTLEGMQVILWHCHSEELQEKMIKLEVEEYKRDYQGVGGGCTVGLRGISLALCMGYSNIHLFGYDSCMGQDGTDHHAYDWADPEESKLIERVHRIQIGPESGPEGEKYYYVAGYMLAQMENFKQFYCNHCQYFTPTFHGEGALSDYFELIKRTATPIEPAKEQPNELRQ